MANPITTIINRFDGGIVNDKRTPLSNSCRMVSNFDIITTPYKLQPYFGSEEGDSASSTSQKRNFAVARRTGTTYSLYGLGVQSGASDAEILYKNLTTTSNDFSDAGWSAPSGTASEYSDSTNSTFRDETFVYYQNQDEIYGIADNQYIFAFNPTTPAFTDREADTSLTITSSSEGLVHSKDDICYIGINNTIWYKDGASAFAQASLAIEASVKVTSIAEYGNFLAIACSPISAVGNSYVLLWDRNTTRTDATFLVAWGEGSLNVIDTIDGILVGVTLIPQSSHNRSSKIVISAYNNTPEAKKLMELIPDTSSLTQLLVAKQHSNNRLYFMMQISIDGLRREGVWSIGRSGPNEAFALTHERTLNGDTASSGSISLKNFIIVGDYIFQSWLDSNYEVSKTKEGASYLDTSIYETVMNPALKTEHRQAKKQLLGIAVKTEPMPNNGTIVVKYRVDSDTAWASLDTFLSVDNSGNDFDNQTVFETRYDATNGVQASEGRDYQFRFETTNGVAITSVKFEYDIMDSEV